MVISKHVKRPNDGPNTSRADIVIKERRGPPEMAGPRAAYRVIQESPAAVVFNCLVRNEPPHPDYLALARSWSGVMAGDRLKIEKMLLGGAGAELLSARWSKQYPGLTEAAFVSYMWLYGTAPTELGYPKAQGAWGSLWRS